MSFRGRALGVAFGLLLDRALGEPPDAWHPVAWFGTAMGRVESRGYADSRAAGARYALAGAGLGLGAGTLIASGARVLLGRPAGTVVGTAAAVTLASAGRMLRQTSGRIEERLVAGDLEGARELLPWLVGRDPASLDASGVSAAVVESLAENTVDAVVCPVFWGLVGGAPAVLLHRAANTMDAMVGHRSERYARFGTAAARLDDVMAWVPARLFALVVAGMTEVRERAGVAGAEAAEGAQDRSDGSVRARRGGGAARVLRIVRRDAPDHPSPNSGVAESSVAAALGVELGGPLRYGERLENRPRLGHGPRPQPADVTRARALVDRAELVLVGACITTAAVLAAVRRAGATSPRRRPRSARPRR